MTSNLSGLLNSTSQRWGKRVDLMAALAQAAKEVLERLVEQTLWRGHPGSVYHSAAQEIICLVERAVCLSLDLQSNELDQVAVQKFTWKVDSGSTVVEIERNVDFGKSPGMFNLKAKDWHIVCQVTTHKEVPAEDIRVGTEVLQAFLKDLNLGISVIGHSLQPISFEDNPSGMAIDAAKMARKLYAARVGSAEGEGVRIQVMLYVSPPGDADHFLYYPSYDCSAPREIPASELESERYRHIEILDGTGHLVERAVALDHENANLVPIYKDEPRLRNCARALSRLSKYIEPEQWSSLSKVFRAEEVRNLLCRCETLLGRLQQEDHTEVWKELLTHPTALAEANLLYRPLKKLGADSQQIPDAVLRMLRNKFFNGREPCACVKPVCWQPREMGTAGRVAKHYVSEFIRSIGKDDSLPFENRASDQSYIMMGMLEHPYGLKLSSAAIVVPLIGKGQLLGTMIAYKDRNGRHSFTDLDVEILESIGGLVGRMLQEAKDYTFFYTMATIWSEIQGGANVKQAHDVFNNAFRALVPFVMNVKEIGEWEVSKDQADVVRFARGGDTGQIKILVPVKLEGASTLSLAVKIEEPDAIFWSHSGELEILFSHCFAIPGAVRYRGGGDGIPYPPKR